MYLEQLVPGADEIVLPPIAPPNRQLTALAEAVAAAAAALLPPSGGLIISVTAGPADRLRIVWWNRRYTRCAEIDARAEEFAPADSAEGRLQRAGAELIAYLAGRWPDGAAPAEIGVVTDGSGLMFAPEHPSPMAPGWLLHLGAGMGTLVAVLPVTPGSTCAELCLAQPSAALH